MESPIPRKEKEIEGSLVFKHRPAQVLTITAFDTLSWCISTMMELIVGRESKGEGDKELVAKLQFPSYIYSDFPFVPPLNMRFLILFYFVIFLGNGMNFGRTLLMWNIMSL